MPYYTYKGDNGKHLVRSIRQLVSLTGLSERSLHRLMRDGFHERKGFVIEGWELEKDGRVNNSNPNIR